jgi:hypothetical protein
MDQGERALLTGLPEVGPNVPAPGWNSLWQNAVGSSLGRDAVAVPQAGGRDAATIWAELSR